MRAHSFAAARESLALFLAALLLISFSAAVAAAEGSIAVRSVKGSFEDVRDRVQAAIENRGLTLNYTARIGAMLERTGKDLGATRRVFEHADAFEFCSAKVSRETMEADPHNIAFCPYVINVYVLPAEPGRVYVSYRRFPDRKGMRPAARLVEEIVAEALR
jgi:uncharacterized protein (DUF302 family)